MSSRNVLIQSVGRSIATVAAFYAASLAASAQEAAAPNEAPPAWLKVCSTVAATNTESCAIIQELRAETGRQIATVTIQVGKEPGKHTIGTVVPIGFVLPPGVGLAVDGEALAAAQYTICIPPSNNQAPVCLAQASINDDFIAALKKGNKLALVVVNPQGKQIPIEMTLAGFSKTFDGPGVDRAAAETRREQLSEALQKSAEEARKKLIEQQQKEIGNTP